MSTSEVVVSFSARIDAMQIFSNVYFVPLFRLGVSYLGIEGTLMEWPLFSAATYLSTVRSMIERCGLVNGVTTFPCLEFNKITTRPTTTI